MRIVIQRVKSANVIVEGRDVAEIKRGLLLLVGVGKDDDTREIERLARKVMKDEKRKMNLNIREVNGQILSVPQFTLYADTRKGNRPGFGLSAEPGMAKEYWERFNDMLSENGIDVKVGVFGAHMEVELMNDGPVTIIL
jgi:D-tyrosyl-tRNA(Tyr) deacylase